MAVTPQRKDTEQVWQTVVRELPTDKKLFYANANVRHAVTQRRMKMEKKALFKKEINEIRSRSLYEAEWFLKSIHLDLDTHLLSDMRIKTEATRCLVRQSQSKPERKLPPISKNYFESLHKSLRHLQEAAAAEDRRVLRRVKTIESEKTKSNIADVSAKPCHHPRFLPPLR